MSKSPKPSTPSKRPPAPSPDTPCRAWEIGHTTPDGHVIGDAGRRLESVAAMSCCANCCENSFPAEAKYVLSTDAIDPKHQERAKELITKLAKGCARQVHPPRIYKPTGCWCE